MWATKFLIRLHVNMFCLIWLDDCSVKIAIKKISSAPPLLASLDYTPGGTPQHLVFQILTCWGYIHLGRSAWESKNKYIGICNTKYDRNTMSITRSIFLFPLVCVYAKGNNPNITANEE